ncbi:MAG: DUF2061 domain-containing protein [bacterium]
MDDSRKKSLVKTITWRIIAFVISLAIVYIYTGELNSAFNISVIGIVATSIAYYFHERIWNKFD